MYLSNANVFQCVICIGNPENYNEKNVSCIIIKLCHISLKFVGSLFIKHSHFSSDREIHRSYVDFTQQSRPSEIIKTIDYRQFII